MKSIFIALTIFSLSSSMAQSYAPPAGQVGTTAIAKDSNIIKGWATGITVHCGYVQIDDTTIQYNGSNRATFGNDTIALGKPSGAATDAVSLGDSGYAILTFDRPIANETGWDFAVFENSITDDFLEFAFVEVSSDGVHFFRFPAHSEVQANTQTSSFGATDCRFINNLAGKYKLNYGTPFDLNDIPDTSLLDKNLVKFVKILDVVGTINPQFATHDSHGNIVNDPYPTPFNSSGFDLTGVGVMHFAAETSVHNNLAEKDNFEVFPTVVNSTLNVRSNGDFVYKIVNLQGEILLEENGQTGNYIIPQVQQLTSGEYFIIIENSIVTENFKFIKR